MIDVIIVDDEPAGRRTVREFCAAEPDLRVVGEYGDGAAAIAAIRSNPPKIVFLDVQMDPVDGIAVARALDPASLPAIVFVTAYESHALTAFEVCAVDYLLKPFDRDRFRRAVARARPREPDRAAGDSQAALMAVLARLERHGRGRAEDHPRLLAELGGHLHVLDAAQVELVQADRNYITIRVGRDSYHARSTLSLAEAALQSEPMLRISRSCLVNMNFVREVNRTLRGDFILVLAGGATVTSSEGFRAKVKDYLRGLKFTPL
jgi:two-component system LytT family response regulator